MFPEENIRRPKKPNFIRYLFLFNLLLLPLFMIVARLVWGQDFFSVSPNGALFWPGAVSHVLLLGGGLVVFRCSVYDLVLPYQQKKLRNNAYAAIYFMAICISWQ
ncbi:TPA: hypothetical protein O8L25_001293 [Enterobacter cloacae]|nr:hypothetical protein [Enterobacter cloacae]